MKENKATTIRFLEGLGYTAAIMIGAAGLTQEEALRTLNVAGLVFGVVSIVRLLAINARMGHFRKDAPPTPPPLNESRTEQENSPETS